MRSRGKTGYLHSLKVPPPTKIFISYKGKNSHFIVEKTRRQHYNQMVIVNITNNKIYSCYISKYDGNRMLNHRSPYDDICVNNTLPQFNNKKNPFKKYFTK